MSLLVESQRTAGSSWQGAESAEDGVTPAPLHARLNKDEHAAEEFL